MSLRLKNYIGGKWVAPQRGPSLQSINPSTEQVVSSFTGSGRAEVDQAVAAAQKSCPSWRLTPAPVRADFLFKAVEIIKRRKKELAILMTQEMGKVLTESLGDVQEAIDIGILMAGEGRRMHGQTFMSEMPNKDIVSVRMPVGVFALITPWNFPIAIPCWKIFPALVAGNTVVFKPSQYTAACGHELVKCCEEAGLPPGVLNLILGSGSEAGDALIAHPGINGISFTGSTAVGRKVGEIAGRSLKKHCLELGGKNCVIVDEDADLPLAIEGAVWSGYGTSGQRCTAGSRIIVHKNVHDRFVKGFVDIVKNLKVGDGLNPKNMMGPLVNEDQLKRVERYITTAKTQDKVTIACGGKRMNSKKGFFFEPTVLTNVKPHHVVAQEEIFGPVVSIIKAESFDDAIKIANGVQYGLSAAVFTKDVNKAHRAARELETAIVYINNASIGAEVVAPFGGIKGTGNGHREAGGAGGAIDTYTEIKVINVDYSGSIQKAQMIEWAVK